MDWIAIQTETPDYYKEVIVFDGKDVYYKYHRLNDGMGEGDYYCCQKTDECIHGVTHWHPLLEKPIK